MDQVKHHIMNVLSLFDGMSCGQIALNRLNKKPTNYYASEIDKWAIQVTQSNYPNTVQLGDINLWKDWNIDFSTIDIVLAGSPCQGFSFAGKQLNFKDSRSKLFFVFLEILQHIQKKNPKVEFLLENVRMKKEYKDVITEHLGIQPIEINSALVSAQNRRRLYWTNITVKNKIEDKNVFLNDILQPHKEVSEALMSEGWYKWWNKKMEFQLKKQYSSIDAKKAICMTSRQYASWNGNFVTIDLKEYFKNTDKPLIFKARNGKSVEISKEDLRTTTFYETRTEKGKKIRREIRKKGLSDTTPRTADCKKYIVAPHNKSNCLIATRSFLDCIIDNNFIVRALTPIECERLQTVPDNYTKDVSNSQRYKMLGNGWTVDVITHILENSKH